MADPRTMRCALAYYRALAGTVEYLDDLRVPVVAPTLVLWGASDPALGTTLVEDCRGVVSGPFEAQVFADAGHWLQQERPREVNAAIAEFAAR